MDLPSLDIGQTITHTLSRKAYVVVPRPDDASPRIVSNAVWIADPLTGIPTSRGVHGLLAAYSWEGWDNAWLQVCTRCRGSGHILNRTRSGMVSTDACQYPCTLGKILPAHWGGPLTLKSGV